MSDVGTTLKAAIARLAPSSPSARADAEILLAHVLGCSRASLAGRATESLAAEQAVDFDRLIERRFEGRPVAHLTGIQEFWSLPLQVTPDVLVPRPESELLVEWAIELINLRPSKRIADLGTGSGAIALAMAQEWPAARIVAMDASAAALKVAQANAHRFELKNIEYVQGSFDMFLSHGDAYDLIVSNPPYIAEGDPHLPALAYEPRHALVSGADGLDALGQIIHAAPARLKPGCWLLLEHGATQGPAVRALLHEAGLALVETRRDLAGHERASGGCRA
ncbi:MAG: peptide chain release factor N(5)-glutamine methyltransferase [Pseudomonadota bacterium]